MIHWESIRRSLAGKAQLIFLLWISFIVVSPQINFQFSSLQPHRYHEIHPLGLSLKSPNILVHITILPNTSSNLVDGRNCYGSLGHICIPRSISGNSIFLELIDFWRRENGGADGVWR